MLCFNNPEYQAVESMASEDTAYVIPSGEVVGVKMYTDGLLVVGVSSIIDENGKEYSPAKEAGMKEGDRITAVNDKTLSSTEEFIKCINESASSITITAVRNDTEYTSVLTPVKSAKDGIYRAGVWVRDSTAGIGTITYYDPEDSSFAGLGHAVTDPDTDKVLTIRDGAVVKCSILSVTKGEKGTPGELNGGLTPDFLGTLTKNSETGIYGNLSQTADFSSAQPIPAANRREVSKGDAQILADIDGKGVKSYTVSIQKFNTLSQDNKGIVFKVTDPALLEATGGIVQGMSGAPIIQNGKLIGAVTHVLVNDPKKGYGVFADLMLANSP